MRALVADDHPLVVDALTQYLREIDPGAEVLGATDMGGALALLAAGGAFDLILLNFHMPGMENLEGLRQARDACSKVPVVMIGGSARLQDMLAALDQGAAGVIPKDYTRIAIIKALELILAGEPHVPARLLGGAGGLREASTPYSAGGQAQQNGPLATLNAREREVLALLSEGLSNADIGTALAMTANGANHHLKNIYRKLGVRKRTQAMAVFFEDRRRPA